MPLIHIGDSTHHHDQAMTPVSLSAMNANKTSGDALWPAFHHRPALVLGCFSRMLNTMAA
jgi:hypothetical protein